MATMKTMPSVASGERMGVRNSFAMPQREFAEGAGWAWAGADLPACAGCEGDCDAVDRDAGEGMAFGLLLVCTSFVSRPRVAALRVLTLVSMVVVYFGRSPAR
ncbi:MAG: hypothetical protein B7X49_17650, partial [Acidiphilium sp. 34-64-41]